MLYPFYFDHPECKVRRTSVNNIDVVMARIPRYDDVALTTMCVCMEMMKCIHDKKNYSHANIGKLAEYCSHLTCSELPNENTRQSTRTNGH